ncbi:RING-H2 finger protein ATL69 [Canna indica]|uniref:RING-H2 finger protein ATL69 n=1 Tax=Canna indica TaxID=4628 RepID=A0AAQ3L0V7_9LILI|nr:RING-H2 finger protein ATL69 [Canna indica]
MWPDAPPSTAGVGLGYGIAIAVGVLVLVSTIMLASYVCIRAKAAPHSPLAPSALALALPGAATTVEVVAAAPGLDSSAIDAFYPKFAFGNGPGGAPPGPCPICLAEYEHGESLRRAPECGHCFHAGCVDEWLRVSATCPLCRSSPVPSAAATPVGTPLSELIPLAAHAR